MENADREDGEAFFLLFPTLVSAKSGSKDVSQTKLVTPKVYGVKIGIILRRKEAWRKKLLTVYFLIFRKIQLNFAKNGPFLTKNAKIG